MCESDLVDGEGFTCSTTLFDELSTHVVWLTNRNNEFEVLLGEHLLVTTMIQFPCDSNRKLGSENFCRRMDGRICDQLIDTERRVI
jgi:hypothetical protein